MDKWTEEDWQAWADDALRTGSVWLLQKGERVIQAPCSEDDKVAFLEMAKHLHETTGADPRG